MIEAPIPRQEPFRHATPASVEAFLDRLTALEVLLRTVAVKISTDRAALEMLRAEIDAQRPL